MLMIPAEDDDAIAGEGVMSIQSLRFILSGEIGNITAIAGMALSITVMLIPSQAAHQKLKNGIAVMFSIIVLFLLWNTYSMRNQLKMPLVENLTVNTANYTLYEAGFDKDTITVKSGDGTVVSSQSIVQTQSIPKGMIIPKDTQIELICASENVYSDENPVYEINEKEEVFSSDNDLSIIIDDYHVFSNGFYYEMPIDENQVAFVDFTEGIAGHFSYSRELTETEIDNWGHGGMIVNEQGQDCSGDGLFFASIEGVFAMQFPSDLPGGNYSYVLYQYLDNQYCEVRIPFTVH